MFRCFHVRLREQVRVHAQDRLGAVTDASRDDVRRDEEFTFSSQSVGRLAATLHTQLKNRLMALPQDEGLLDELLNVRLRETAPGVLRIDHDADKHDDRVIALALATQEALRLVPTAVGIGGRGGRTRDFREEQF